MNTRICSVIAVVTLLALSSGCSGMRNFLFGRGARCGLCSNLSNGIRNPQFGNTMQAPYAQTGPSCQTPQYQGGIDPTAGCGCNSYVGNEYDGQVYSSGSAYNGCGCAGECGCGNFMNYSPMVSDPYMSGEIGGTSMPYQDQIISGQGYPNSIAPIQPDDFNARKFDSDGNRILWEEPLPQGTNAL